MSGKIRTMKRESEQKVEKQGAKQEDVRSRAYMPTSELPITGEEFMTLRFLLKEARNKRISVVINNEGKLIGQTMPNQDMDIDEIFAYVERMHKKFYDKGLTVDIETLRNELSNAQSQEEVKQD